MRLHGLTISAATLLLSVHASQAGDVVAPPRTGSFSTTEPATERLGDSTPQYETLFSSGEEITWQRYVPPDYSPDRPAGLFVYISPTRSGAMPKKWRSTMDKYNLIWIGADSSGNRTRVPRRVLLSLLAVNVAREEYALDDARIYVGGFSGGGRVSSMVAADHAQTFSGGLFICGAELWDVDSPRYIDAIRQNRYVFLTGDSDQALEPTKRAFRGFRRAGVEQTKLMIIRDMGHSTPRGHDFARAIAFLDGGGG